MTPEEFRATLASAEVLARKLKSDRPMHVQVYLQENGILADFQSTCMFLLGRDVSLFTDADVEQVFGDMVHFDEHAVPVEPTYEQQIQQLIEDEDWNELADHVLIHAEPDNIEGHLAEILQKVYEAGVDSAIHVQAVVASLDDDKEFQHRKHQARLYDNYVIDGGDC